MNDDDTTNHPAPESAPNAEAELSPDGSDGQDSHDLPTDATGLPTAEVRDPSTPVVDLQQPAPGDSGYGYRVPAGTRKLWDQQPDEPDYAFLLFAFYRDMIPAERSIRKAYRDLTKKTLDEPVSGGLYNYAKKYNWAVRVKAYDASIETVLKQRDNDDQQAFDAHISFHKRKFRKNELALACLGMNKVAEILKMPLTECETTELKDGKTIIHKHAVISPQLLFAAAALMKTSSQVGRAALNMADDSDSEEITPEQFKKKLFRTVALMERSLQPGATPLMPANVAAKPDFHNNKQFAEAGNGNGNGNDLLTPVQGPRERP